MSTGAARPRPLGLVVLDGFGHAPDGPGNAVGAARMPHYRAMLARFPHTLLAASGDAVGLMPGDMGNSNVGHLTMGAGRILRLGLLSPGGVHSDQDQVFALIDHLRREAGAGVERAVFVHAFLDGRDVPPKSARPDLEALEDHLRGFGRVATVGGRYYGMDRDPPWERIEAAYRAMAGQAGERARSALDALAAAYERDEGDEFVRPTRIVGEDGEDVGPIRSGDLAFFWNFRADRALELMTMVEYDAAFPLPVALGPLEVRHTVGEVVAAAGLRQLRAAETEKYAHVTYFFNGGEETQFPAEERILVPSPKVATYDLEPAMAAAPLTDRVCAALAEPPGFDLFVLNYANPDMVGHTGDMAATVAALEALDACLGRLREAVFALGGGFLLTADHGNAEAMRDEATGQARTAHTTAPVPAVLCLPGWEGARLRTGCGLVDVGPTLLALMGLALPAEMEGRSLIEARA
jgi:2,3-bisphosphoglycerate-independent phosphoglycerate mutase